MARRASIRSTRVSTTSAFADAQHYQPVASTVYRGAACAAHFGNSAGEYEAARTGAALFERSDRGRIVVTGRDRKAWLHNLITNAVTTLDDYQGNYAFAVNVQGRILFDLNVLTLLDALWLDIDTAARAAALAHFDRHLFTEDVKPSDATAGDARLGCSGPRTGDLARKLGAANFAALPALACVLLGSGEMLVRHDFTGQPGFELFVPRAAGPACWDRLVELGARPAGLDALDALRAEAGIPWLGRDLDETVLPPETGQAARGLSYQKGCYLGQEVMERMRAHGALARRLARLRIEDGADVSVPADLVQSGVRVGRITSLVRHPAKRCWVGLGYLRTTVTDLAGIVAGAPPRAVCVVCQ